MRIIALRTPRAFWTEHADAEAARRAWYADARHAEQTVRTVDRGQ
jgi:hypothetical protein